MRDLSLFPVPIYIEDTQELWKDYETEDVSRIFMSD
jgi:hypothetical protein